MYGCCPLFVSSVRGFTSSPSSRLPSFSCLVFSPLKPREKGGARGAKVVKGGIWEEERRNTHPGPPIINLPPSPVPINVDGSSVSVFVDFAFSSLSSFSRFVIYYQPLLSICSCRVDSPSWSDHVEVGERMVWNNHQDRIAMTIISSIHHGNIASKHPSG